MLAELKLPLFLPSPLFVRTRGRPRPLDEERFCPCSEAAGDCKGGVAVPFPAFRELPDRDSEGSASEVLSATILT